MNSALQHGKSNGKDLAKYDPEKGVKAIAVAEMAERHYARAKNAEQLEVAIRRKLELQAEFIEWWDKRGPGANHGAPRGNVNAKKQR